MLSKVPGRKFRIFGVTLAIICFCAIAAFAVNSAGKPTAEPEVPGDWTADHGSLRYLWFRTKDANGGDKQKPLTEYSFEVRKNFPDPDMSEFGDHPDFNNGMNDNYDDPEGIVKILTNAQMNAYLESLPKDNMTIRYMGDYPKGIRMPLLVFSKPKLSDPSGENLRALDKPVYYLRAQVHGNEIATTGGAVLLAQRLARGHADLAGVLDKISIVILPRMNGDGTKLHQRGTSLVSGDSWGTGTPNYLASIGEGGGLSEYGGGIMAGLDQNRDNLWLGTPASRANARILAEYKPEVCLDAHEYGASGYFGLPDTEVSGDKFYYKTRGDKVLLRDPFPGTLVYYKEQMTTQWGNHLMIPETLRNKSEAMQQKLIKALADPSNPSGSFYWAPYVEGSYGLKTSKDSGDLAAAGLIPLSSLPAGEQRDKMARWADGNGMVINIGAYNSSTEGGFDPGTARNTMALTPAISFLAESRNAGGKWEYPRRVMGQYLTSLNIIRAMIDDLDDIKSEVAKARSAVIADVGNTSRKIAIRQDYAQSNYSNVEAYGIYLQDGSSMDVPGLRRNSRFGTVPTFEVSRPYAYVMDGGYIMADTIAYRMSNLGIRFERLTEDTELGVTAYTVTDVRAPAPSFGGSCRIDGVSQANITKVFPAGSYVFPMAQEMGNFIAALFEPVSMRSWAGKDLANMDVVLNKETPFYRYEKPGGIANTEYIYLPSFDFTDVFLYNVKPFAIDDLEEARTAAGSEGYAQTMTVYGNLRGVSSIRAYLPARGMNRQWRILENGEYALKPVNFDSGMNRDYITIDVSSLKDNGNGYYDFDLFVGGDVQDSGGGSSGGCDAGLGALALVLALSLGAARTLSKKR